MNLIIDAGNSAVKLAFFEEGKLITTQIIDPVIDQFKGVLVKNPKVESILICDVRGINWSFLNSVFDSKRIFMLDSSWKLPFKIDYKSVIGGETERIDNTADTSILNKFGWRAKINLYDYIEQNKVVN